MTSPEEPAVPAGEAAVLKPLAESLELSFTEQHLSLADPRVRAVFDLTMDIAVHLTRGAAAQGIVDAGQQQQLAGLLEGAKRAAALMGE